MKNILYNIALMLFVALAAVSCENSTLKPSVGGGDGVLKMNVSVAGLGGSDDANAELMKRSHLRIYNSDGGLLRSYAPATDAPSEISLVEGSYKAVMNIDSDLIASHDTKSYYGESDFTVSAKVVSHVKIDCKIINILVNVAFDPTIKTVFGTDFKVTVAAMDLFDETKVNETPEIALPFYENGIGHFILPEGVKNISWGFGGESATLGTVIDDGVITAPLPAHAYTLNFKYSKTPGGSAGITVELIEDGDIYYDDFTFTIQPTIKGKDFDILNTVPFVTEPISYLVESFNGVRDVNVMLGNDTYSPFLNGKPVDLSATGISYTVVDDKNGVITLDGTFLTNVKAGVNIISMSVYDTGNNVGNSNSSVAVPGMVEPIVDLWNNTAKLQMVVTDPAVTEVSFKYKETSSADWKLLTATSPVDYLYEADILPEWVEGKNEAALTVFTVTDGTGIFANNSYDFKAIVDGAETNITLTTDVNQVIPQGGFEDSGMSNFTTSNGGATTWASGNNTFGKDLCSQSTYAGMTGNHVARLKAKSVIGGILAAGNTHLGTFKQSGTSGVAAFGQPYSWTARPKTLKVKYHASVGKVDISKHGGAPIGKGDQDISRIFVAIIDWSSRRGVTAGTNAPTGLWGPHTSTSLEQGQIIGYALLDINQTTAGSTMIDAEIPIYYYDKVTKPSKAYQLTVNAATSAYGDYMVGCSSNVMYVDDFRFGY